MLIGWTDVCIRNDSLNKLDDIPLKGLPIIGNVLSKMQSLNVTSGYDDKHWMIVELL